MRTLRSTPYVHVISCWRGQVSVHALDQSFFKVNILSQSEYIYHLNLLSDSDKSKDYSLLHGHWSIDLQDRLFN